MAGFGWILSIGFIGAFAALNVMWLATVLSSTTRKRSAVPGRGASR